MKYHWHLLKIRNAALVAAILTALELFGFQYKWLGYHLLGTLPAQLEVSKKRICVYVVLVAIVLLWSILRSVLVKADTFFHTLFPSKQVRPLSRHTAHLPVAFAFLAFSCGLILVFFNPPFASPDENAHYHQSVFVANGQLLPRVDQSGYLDGTADADTETITTKWVPIVQASGAEVHVQALVSDFFAKADRTPTVIEYRYPNNAFLLYLPQAIGIKTGSLLFHLFGTSAFYNAYQQLLYARLFNLFFFVCMGFAALALIPIFKRTLFLVLLMPMTLFMATTCNADVFVYAVCMLTVAFILHLAYDNRVVYLRYRHIAILALLFGLLLFAKMIYFSLFACCLFIPKEKYRQLWGSRLWPAMKKAVGMLLPIAAGGLLFGVWYLAMKHAIHGMVPGSDYVRGALAAKYAQSESLQTQYILHHPLRSILVAWYAFFYHQGFLATMVGSFGWLDVSLSWRICKLYALLLAGSAILERISKRFRPVLRIALLVAIAATGLLVMISQYICWTPHPNDTGKMVIGGNDLIGIQGRYFIPMLFGTLLLLANGSSRRSIFLDACDRRFNQLVWIVPCFFLAITLRCIATRYYIG